jgi:uncharacterized membrane protein (UPF0127 family)
MIVENSARGTSLGGSIEVAATSKQKSRGLLGRKGLEDGEGMLFKGCGSIHTFFMHFPIDILFLNKEGKVLKAAPAVRPFRLVAAPLRAYYVIELPAGAIERSQTRRGDVLHLTEREPAVEGAGLTQRGAQRTSAS